MAVEFTTQETAEAVASLKKYASTELEIELSELRAKLLLDYVVKEIAPVAYNCGVRDAEQFLRGRLEDLSATCFEAPFGYWQAKRRR